MGFQDWPGKTAMTSSANLGRAAPRAFRGGAPRVSGGMAALGAPTAIEGDGYVLLVTEIKESSIFQFLRGALVSHATQCTRSRLRRTLLF